MPGKTKTVTQRTGKQTCPGCGTYQRKLRKLKRNRSCSGAFANHNIHTEIFHRHIEHFFCWAAHTVYFVKKKYLARCERRQNRSQITRMLNCWPGGNTKRCLHLSGNNHCQGSFAQPGRAGKQHVVGTAPTHFRGFEHERKLLTHALLPHEVVKRLRTQCRLNHFLLRFFFHCNQTLPRNLPWRVSARCSIIVWILSHNIVLYGREHRVFLAYGTGVPLMPPHRILRSQRGKYPSQSNAHGFLFCSWVMLHVSVDCGICVFFAPP